MKKLDNIVPSLELCRLIPKNGTFYNKRRIEEMEKRAMGSLGNMEDDEETAAILKRLESGDDFSSESFVGGVSSGVAIRYRLTGMETKAGKIEGEMKKALQRRVEIICGIASLKRGEEVFRDISIDFKRNIPEDYTSIINMINSLKGTVSDSTLLSLLPFVEDVNAELAAVQEQKQANMALYNFGSSTEGDEE